MRRGRDRIAVAVLVLVTFLAVVLGGTMTLEVPPEPVRDRHGRQERVVATVHAGQIEIGSDELRNLLRAQMPEWADLPVERVDSGGTTNAIFRLGTELSARLPLTYDGVDGLHREARWLPVLAAAAPLPIPEVVAVGHPGDRYPWDWAVHRWIDGDVLVEGRVSDPDAVARDLAAFILSLSDVDVAEAPRAHRGGSLADADAETRDAIDELARTDEPLDPSALVAAWEAALAVPHHDATPHWVHSDLMPSNILGARDGRLAAVIDFSTAGIGDPAVDLVPAWNLLPAASRRHFRDAVHASDDAWARGRGWALSMAIIQLPYYRTTNAVIAANARYVLAQVLGDQPRASTAL